MPTLEEIAHLAGVSRSTVSRVINEQTSVKEETRERVLQVIQEANFRPSTAARRLAGGRSGIYGLVIPMGVATLFTDPYFPILLQSVSATCNSQAYSVMLWLAEPEHERNMIGQIINNDILDGVIVSSMAINDPIITALENSHVPFVLIGRDPYHPSASFIDIDNRGGARKIVNHLIKQGRKRIATITGPQNMIASLDRLDGYKQALSEAGLSVDPEMIKDGKFTDNGGYRSTVSLLDKQPDAIFAASDLMCLGVLRALNERDYQVPDDIAVVGFDDAPFSKTTEPALTTVVQRTDQLGSRAVEILTELIENSNPFSMHDIIPTEIVIRQSG